MASLSILRNCFAVVFVTLGMGLADEPQSIQKSRLRAGVATVDISPTKFPSIIAGGFLEAKAEQVHDPLMVRCFVLDNGNVKLALAIVDTCMMTRELIDQAKQIASRQCGIPVNHMMVSATHTHSAPAAMACLGTRQDKAYAEMLPGKIAQAIVDANARLQPARTAGLEIQAEPRIVDSLIQGLEVLTGKPGRHAPEQHRPYAEKILGAKPIAYWRLNDMQGDVPLNAVEGGLQATLGPGYAWYLPGVGSGAGVGDQESLRFSSFSGNRQINRAIHFAGGQLKTLLPERADPYSIAVWFWLGEPSGASVREGTLLEGPWGEAIRCLQDAQHHVRLDLDGVTSKTTLLANEWHLAVLVRNPGGACVYIDGQVEIVHESLPRQESKGEISFARGLQGKLDEIAIFPRALSAEEILAFWTTASAPPAASPSSEQTNDAPTPNSEPIEPKVSLQKLHVPEGYQVELVACEPQVVDPVAFDWDDRGRLWVVEMSDYPLGMDGQGQPGGRIRVLEDVDQDGFFENSQIFADGLSFPNGILTWRDGVLVTAAPDILLLRDTDQDGKSDQREVLFTGFHQGNQQLRLNGLRWGLDGWVYCANGGHHANYGKETKIESTRTGKRIDLGSRDFRFQPDTGAIELESGPTQFGRNRDAWGHWFGTQNANPLWHYVLPDRYLSRNPYVPVPIPLRHLVGPGSPVVFPASPLEKRFHSFEQSGRFTSACGGMIYGDDKLFASGDAMHAFTCEPFHNLIQHNILEDAGVSYVARRSPDEKNLDFFASEDRWCRPVMARTGPDGALWIADMYRYMIEHPDWLPALGKEELLPHYRLGDDRGRIYRVTRSTSPKTSTPNLEHATTSELIQYLDTANDWQRDQIHKRLLWKKSLDAVPLLAALAREARHAQARAQSLWILENLDSLQDQVLLGSLSDPHPRVRENAIRLAENRSSDSLIQAACQLSHDSDGKVRLQLALSAGNWGHRAEAALALAEVANRDHEDALASAAIMSSALPHAKALRSAILRSGDRVINSFSESFLRMAVVSADHQGLASLLATSMKADSRDSIAPLTQMLKTLERCGSSWDQLKESKENTILANALANGNRIFADAKHLAQDNSGDPKDRIAAAALLTHASDSRTLGIEALARWIDPKSSWELQSAALEELSQSGDERVPQILAQAFRMFSPTLRDQAIDVWLSRSVWSEDLLDRIAQQEIPSGNLDPTRRDRLLRHPVKAVSSRAATILQTPGTPSRTKVVEKMRATIEWKADVAQGKAVYLRVCAACHRRGDEGLDIGPNLATVVSHPPEKLLSNIFDPNADILPGFQRYSCLLDSGVVLTGLLTSETAHSVTMKLADGKLVTLARTEIELLQNSNASLMPEEFEKLMRPQEVADLIAFLRSPIDSTPQADATSGRHDEPSEATATPVSSMLLEATLDAVGGRQQLLTLFRMKERLAVSSDPAAVGNERISVLEPPAHWWLGTKDRVTQDKEPAILLVAAWTLNALIDGKASLETIPDIQHEDRPAYGIRIRRSIEPAMDCYFNRDSKKLVRIDWRGDKHVFSEWKTVDGMQYPSKCIGYKLKDNKHWYHTEILEIERLTQLPPGLTR